MGCLVYEISISAFDIIGVPEGTRTPDLRFRKPPLYPAELPGQNATSLTAAVREHRMNARAGANWLSSRRPRLARLGISANDRLADAIRASPNHSRFSTARLSASFRGRGRLPVSGKATISTGLALPIVCARGGVILYSAAFWDLLLQPEEKAGIWKRRGLWPPDDF
jgi:hypothetical protein